MSSSVSPPVPTFPGGILAPVTASELWRTDAGGNLIISAPTGTLFLNQDHGIGVRSATALRVMAGFSAWGAAVPGAQPGAIVAPTAPGAVYVQAEAQSAVTAINAIYAALQGAGIMA